MMSDLPLKKTLQLAPLIPLYAGMIYAPYAAMRTATAVIEMKLSGYLR